MDRQASVASDPVLKSCHKANRVAAQGDHPRAQLDDIQASVAPFALADVGLPLSKRLGELHLRHAYESFDWRGVDYRSVRAEFDGFDRMFHISTVSKRFAAPGLRIGFLRGPAKVTPELWDECLLQTGGLSRVNQLAACGLLTHGKEFTREVAATVAKRRMAVAALTEADLSDHGGIFYTYLMRRPGSSDLDLALRLARAGIGTVPGTLLGFPGSLRVSLSADEDQLVSAVNTIVEVDRSE